MQRGRLTTAMVAAISIPALGLGVGAVTSAARAASRAPASPAVAGHLFSEQTVAVNCQGRPQVRPSSFTLACADANDSLTRLSWANWGSALASATGIQEENDCVPDCAAGHFHRYPVDAIFWGFAAIPGHPGSQRYPEVTVLYPGARPGRAGNTVTMPLP